MRRLFLISLIICGIAAAQQSVNIFDGPPLPGWTKVWLYDASDNLEYVCYASPYSRDTTTWTITATTLTSIVDASNTSTATTSAAHGLIIGNTVTVANALSTNNWVKADITSVTDSSNTSTILWGAAHGLDNNDVITLSDFTVDTDLNGTYLFTKVNTTSGTITTANVSDAVYVDSTMVIDLGDSDLNGVYRVLTTASTTTFTITTANVTDGTFDEYGAMSVTTTAPLTKLEIWSIERRQYDSAGNATSRQWAKGTMSAKVRSAASRFVCDDASALVYE
jgi:hypothetical protein